MKRDGRKLDHATLEEFRLLAVRRVKEGEKAADVVKSAQSPVPCCSGRPGRLASVLVYLIAGGVFVAGCGRLLSMSKVGLPEPRAVWLGYLAPELGLPWVLAVAHSYRP